MIYNKLVRDKIIDIIKSKGEKPVYRTLNNEEYKIELIRKLTEELKELEEALKEGSKENILEESSDLLEVIKALNELNNYDIDDIIRCMNDKREKKGGFQLKLFLESVED